MSGLWEHDGDDEAAGDGIQMSWTVGSNEQEGQAGAEGDPNAATVIEQETDEEETTEDIEMTEVLDLRVQREAEALDAEQSNWSEVTVESIEEDGGGVDENASPCLILSSPSGSREAASRVSVDLSVDELCLGRSQGPELLRKDPFLSDRHARIVRDGDGFVIEDLDSLNGLYREVQGEVALEDGQWIRLGKHVFLFNYLSGVRVQTRDRTVFAATPNPGYWAKLQTALGPETFGSVWALVEDETEIGRTRGSLKMQGDAYVSASHARIRRTEHGAVLEDLDSANGTFVSIDRQPLEDGDRFLIGQHILEFRSG